MPKAKSIKNIYLFFISFLIIFVLNLIIPISFFKIPSYTSRMWLIFQIYVMGFAIFILIKERLPRKNIIIGSLVLGVLTVLNNPMVSVWNALIFMCTVLTFMASSSIFQKSEDFISLFFNFSKNGILKSIGIGIIAGVILAFINLLLSGNQQMNMNISIHYFLLSLNPGIFEEVSFRLFMYAFCIYLLNGKANTRKENIWCYIIMVIPHVLIHTPDMFFRNGFFHLDASVFVTIVMLSLIFGLPFALLQKKRDLSSAMIAHGLVDFVRFCFLGIPM
jgi:CAAX amino terminal protease family.